MSRSSIALALGLAAAAGPILAAPDPPADDLPPPVPLRILAPLHQLFYQPGPTAVAPLAPGSWRLSAQLSESNVLHPAKLPAPKAYAAELDFEMTRLALGIELGATERWTLGAELPLLSFHSGVLDGLIFETEQALGRVLARRRGQSRGEFAFRAAHEGNPFFDVPSGGVRPGDLALTARRHLRAQDGQRPALALRLGLKLPTGSRDRGTGSGEGDVMLGTAAVWRLGQWGVSSGLAATLPVGEVRGTPGLRATPNLTGYAEVSYRRGERLGLHLQLAGATQPFTLGERSRAGIGRGETRSFAGHVLQVTLAGSWRFASGHRLYVGLVEDILETMDTAADISLFTALTLSPAAPGRAKGSG